MSPRWLCPRVPHSLPIERFLPFSSPTQTSVPLRLQAILSHLVEAITATWTTACHWRLQMRRSCQARLTTPPSASSSGMDADLFRVLSNAVEELGLDWSPPEEPTRSRLDEWFLPGHRQANRQQASPFFPEVSMTRSPDLGVPYSSCLISVRPPPLAGR